MDRNQEQDSDGNITIIPKERLVRPVRPTTKSSTTWNIYKEDNNIYEKIIDANDALRVKLINSIPEVVKSKLSHPELELLNITSLDIMNYLSKTYGTMTKADYDDLDLKLTDKLDATKDFANHVVALEKIFDKLDNNDQPKSEREKCNILKKSVNHLQPIKEAIAKYLKINPAIRDQKFKEMVAHVELHSANFDTTSSDMGYAGKSVQPETATSIVESQPFKDAAIYVATKESFKPYQQSGRGDSGRGHGFAGRGDNFRGRGFAGRGNNIYNNNGRGDGYRGHVDTGRGNGYMGRGINNSGRGRGYTSYNKYCSLHGENNTHMSIDCNYMYHNSGEFSSAQRHATAPLSREQ